MCYQIKEFNRGIIASARKIAAIFSALIISAVITTTVAADKMTLPTPDYDALIAKANEKGFLPIIVMLRMDFTPEGNLPNRKAILQQREEIDSLQNSVLERLDKLGTSPASVKRFKLIPSIAMEVEPNGLEQLITFPEIKQIGEDKADPLLDAM